MVAISTGLARQRTQGGGAKRSWPAPLPRGDARELAGTAGDRALGARMAELFFAFGVAYAVVVVAGFVSLGNLSKPLPDPVKPSQPRTSSAAAWSVAASPEINSVVTIDSRQRSRSSRIFSLGPIRDMSSISLRGTSAAASSFLPSR